MPENIIAKLHRVAKRYSTTTADIEVAIVMNEAADEIEYLRQRCVELDNQEKQERFIQDYDRGDGNFEDAAL